MSPFSEPFIVFQPEMKRSLRSAKTLVLLVLYALATVISGLVFIAATRSLQDKLNETLKGQELPPEALMQMKLGGLSVIFGKDEEQLKYLASMPLVVIFFAWFALFFLPLLTALIGFDQVSGELQTRSIRFVSLRARRGSLLAGKVLAQLALLLGLTAVMNLAIFGYAALSIQGFPVGPGFAAMARFWALTLVYATAYVGVATLCSCLFRTPIFSFLTAVAYLFVTWVLALLAHLDRFKWVVYALPSHYEDGFFKADPLAVLGSVGALCGFAAAFLALSYLALRTRDV